MEQHTHGISYCAIFLLLTRQCTCRKLLEAPRFPYHKRFLKVHLILATKFPKGFSPGVFTGPDKSFPNICKKSFAKWQIG